MKNIGKTLFGSIALIMLPLVLTGCSDNEENGLYAASDSDIKLLVYPGDDKTWNSNNYHIGADQADPVFIVDCTSRWTVVVTDCEGAWCQIGYGNDNKSDDIGQIKDGAFYINAAPNRSENERSCNVTIYAIDRDGVHIPGVSKEINIIQDRKSINVDYTQQEIPFTGITSGVLPMVTVTANQAWTVSTTQSWVTIIPGEGMDGDSFTPPAGSNAETTTTLTFKVEPNPGTAIRYAELTFSSPTSAFTPIRRTVTQLASTESFFISPTEYTEVSRAGAELPFSIYSPLEGWTAKSSAPWVTLDKTSSPASTDPVTLKATVAPNDSIGQREAKIVIVREGDAGEMGTYNLLIRQDGKSGAFTVTPSEIPNLSYSGESIDLSVYSPGLGWRAQIISDGNWLSLNQDSHSASDEAVAVKLTASANLSYVSRDAVVVFSQEQNRIVKEIYIKQNANPNVPQPEDPDFTPKVSAPWLSNGWNYNKAVIMAYYVSPVHSIDGCGVLLQSNGNETNVSGTYSDGLIRVEVSGLSPNTTYTVRAYITYIEGSKIESGEAMTFTTPDNNAQPGVTPGIDDNNPPSNN